jgi:hypothetical protein
MYLNPFCIPAEGLFNLGTIDEVSMIIFLFWLYYVYVLYFMLYYCDMTAEELEWFNKKSLPVLGSGEETCLHVNQNTCSQQKIHVQWK